MSGKKGMKRTVKVIVSEETRKKISDTLKKRWKIIFIWEHEINDDWFWIGDYIKGGDANA